MIPAMGYDAFSPLLTAEALFMAAAQLALSNPEESEVLDDFAYDLGTIQGLPELDWEPYTAREEND